MGCCSTKAVYILVLSHLSVTRYFSNYMQVPRQGHSGYHKTVQLVKANFFWDGLRSFVHRYIRECDICQCNKAENVSPAGLLQPLTIPSKVWSEITMDFIDGLPSSQGKNVIMVVADRLSKYAHFIPFLILTLQL